MSDIVDDARDYAGRMMQGHAAGLVNRLVRELLMARSEIERLRAELLIANSRPNVVTLTEGEPWPERKA